MGNLSDWVSSMKRGPIDSDRLLDGDGGPSEADIKANAQHVEVMDPDGSWLAAWDTSDHAITIALFEWCWSDDSGAHYGLTAVVTGFVAFSAEDDPQDEMRHLWIGEDGYLYYPKMDALAWWFGVVRKVYQDAQAARYPKP